MFRLITVFVLGAAAGGFTSPRAGAADAPKPLVLEGHAAGVPSVAFVGEGKVLVSGSEDKTVKLWNVADGKEIATLKGHAGGIQSVAATRDGKLIASADDTGAVKVWEVETQKELHTLKGGKGDAAGLAFSSDGKLLAVGGGGFDKAADKAWGEIRLWDPATGKEAGVLSWPGNRVNAIAFSPDGALLASCSSNGAVALWDVATAKKKTDLGKNPRGGTGLAFSPDGKTVACGNFIEEMTIKFWDVGTGKETRTIESKATVSAFSLAFLPDGKTLAVGGFDREGVRDSNSRGAYVALWDIEEGKLRTALTGHMRGVTCISLNRDGTRLAASGLDKSVRVWELPKSKDK
jgi:WD40 repeat protein